MILILIILIYGFSLQSWTTPHLTRTCFMADMTESTEALGMDQVVIRISTVSFLGQYPYANHGAGIFTYITGWFWTRANLGKYSSTMVSLWDITRNLTKITPATINAKNRIRTRRRFCTSTYPIGSMVLVYMLTWLGYIDGKCYHI